MQLVTDSVQQSRHSVLEVLRVALYVVRRAFVLRFLEYTFLGFSFYFHRDLEPLTYCELNIALRTRQAWSWTISYMHSVLLQFSKYWQFSFSLGFLG